MNTQDNILRTITDYQEGRAAKGKDSAWYADDGTTNYKLKDGDKVSLLYSTIGDGPKFVVHLAIGTLGTVVTARTPRTLQPRVRKPRTYIYFANVDFEIGGVKYRGRVPHNALKKLRKTP